MSLATLVVTAVRIEGRTKAEVARTYGVTPRWIYELCRRFDACGEAGLEPRSRRPRSSPHRTSDELEEIARSDDTDVPVLRGWRRKLFGEDALALKRGELALVIKDGEVAVRRADDQT